MKNLVFSSLLSLFASQAPAADWFQEDFAKVPAGPTWELPAQNVKLADGTLQFTGQGDAGRVYLRTVAADYAKQSFIAEATVTILKGVGPVGIAFFGLGCGQANPGFYYSPNTPPALYAMVCPNGFGGGIFIGACNNQETNVPGPGDGTHRLRMIWDAATKRAKFEISPNWDGKATFTAKFATTVNAPDTGFTEANARLFLGAGAGTSFDDFSVRAATAGEIQAADFGESFANDPSARTWLPAGKAVKCGADPVTAPVDAFIRNLGGNFRPLACWYRDNRLIASRAFNKGKAETTGAKWSCNLETRPAKGDKTALDLKLTARLLEGTAASAGIAAAFDFTGWTTDNYILAPAQIYGGNRFRIYGIGYPPYIQNEKDRPLDMPVTTTNILHLNPDGSAARIEMNTGNVATPMLSFFNPKEKRGFILLAEQGTRFGNNGLFIQEDAGPATAEKRLTFVVSAPGVREQRYTMCGRGGTGDRGADWKAGDELTLRFKLYNFPCPDMAAFYAKIFDVRKALSDANTFSCVTPYSACADLILEHHNRNKWFENDQFGYYTNRPGSTLGYHNQVGWNGVPIFSLPSLIAETPERLRRVSLSIDSMIVKTQGKTGLYYAMGDGRGKFFGDTHATMAQRPAISMTRRSMDVLYFGIRTLELLKQRGHADMVKPEWEKSFRACADGLVKVWQDYGQFGQFIDVETGKMDTNGSTAGCAAGAGLALAAKYFKEPKYLEVAEAATRMYHERDFLKGYAGGGAAEILQSPDSEAPWDMVESCIALYEITGKPEWLERAKFATHTLATWMVSYDYKFPPNSGMGKAGIHAAGSIFASSQNNHSAPGYYILSGDMLLKLFRATGDPRYAEMYKDQSHNVVQYVGAPHNPLGKPNGYVTERVQLSDWEGGDIGSINHGDSNMAWELLAVLTCLENPGIYLHTDDDTLLVMDHVEAQIIGKSWWKGTKTLQIKNPTAYDATVSILAESAKQAKTPLGWGAHDKWPKVNVKAGKTITVQIGQDGKIGSGK